MNIDHSPKFVVMSYYAIINDCIFDILNDGTVQFVKENGQYIVTLKRNSSALRNKLIATFESKIKQRITEYDITSPRYYFITDDCYPKDNVVLRCITDEFYFPTKLKKIIDSNVNVKFAFKEHDVVADVEGINDLVDSVFNDYFEHSKKKIFKKYCNLFFIRHVTLDYITIKNIFRFIYGRNNVLKQQIDPKHEYLININTLINKYIRQKSRLNGDKDFKLAVAELSEYINQCLKKVEYGKK